MGQFGNPSALLVIQRDYRRPYLGYPGLRLGPNIIFGKEKVQISNSVWHSVQNPAIGTQMTRIEIACVPVQIYEILF